MARKAERGTALAVVLMVAALMLVVCLSLATLSVLNLNLANAAVTDTQMRLLAQAAVSQFVSDDNALNAAQRTNALQGAPAPPDLKLRYTSPVFQTGAEDLPGNVAITFDSTRPLYSVDNSNSESPAASSLDVGTATSVPPFCICLVMQVESRGQTRVYEAILRRIWPFAALSTCGPISLCGAPASSAIPIPTPSSNAGTACGPCCINSACSGVPPACSGASAACPNGSSQTVNPSNVTGDIANMLLPAGCPLPGVACQPATCFTSSCSLQEPPEERMAAALIRDSCLQLARVQPSKTTLGAYVGDDLHIYDTSKFNAAPITLRMWVGACGQCAKCAQDVTVSTKGQILVSAPANDITKTVTDVGNQLEGNANFLPAGTYTSVAVEPQNQFVGREKNGIVLRGITTDPGQLASLPDPSTFTPVPPEPHVNRGNLNIGTHKAFYHLEKTLVLGPASTTPTSACQSPGNACFVPSNDTQYVINESAGNRFFEVTPKLQLVIIGTGAGIQLNNCTLFVNGNLDLSATESDTPTRPSLVGTNATLIVTGTLLLRDGSLDARDQGMVIYANEIISQAKGDYNGLIIANHAAVFYPPTNPDDRLTINGGIVVGGQPTQIAEGLPDLTGLTLFSTTLTYDPRFLKSLHQFGDLKLMTLHPAR